MPLAAGIWDCYWGRGGMKLLGEITCPTKTQAQRIPHLGVWKEGLEQKPLLFFTLLLIAIFETWDLWRKHYSKGQFTTLYYLFIYLFFLGPHLQHMEVPRLGSNWSCSCQPAPQPQQHHIWAMFTTYTPAPGNTWSLTHWARPGIESATLWFLVGFVSAAPWQELYPSL